VGSGRGGDAIIITDDDVDGLLFAVGGGGGRTALLPLKDDGYNADGTTAGGVGWSTRANAERLAGGGGGGGRGRGEGGGGDTGPATADNDDDPAAYISLTFPLLKKTCALTKRR
jgi:hypothetical protein